MRSSGSQHPKLIIIGEAPGEDEDRKGEPFVGRSGQLLRNVLQELEFDLSKDVRFTNVVRCRPPENKINKKAIDYCKEFAIQEVEQYKPQWVFLMGGSPLTGILGESGITNWNGVIVPKNGTTYVPLFHPAYILRNENMMRDWLGAMLTAIGGDVEKQKNFERVYPQSLSELRSMEKYLEGQEVISYDTEVSALDPYSDYSMMLAVSFSGEEVAYSYPLYHPEAKWSEKELSLVVDTTHRILMSHSGSVIGHNVKFDQLQTASLLDTWFNAEGDTMLISHLLDSRRGIHGLKRLAGIHIGMYEYEQELTHYIQEHPEANPKKGGSYAFVPLDILLPYSAMDAEATYRLSQELFPKLSFKQKVLYSQLIMPVSNVLAKVQHRGMCIDGYIAQRYWCIYSTHQQKVYEEILGDPKVKRMMKAKNEGVKRLAQFNPNSSQQLGELLYGYYHIPIPGKTETGRPSVNSGLLKPLEEKHPIIKKVRYYKLLGKMLSTYIYPAISDNGWRSGDGLVHTTYNLHGTVTGRLSSSEPNLQNIPTPEKEPGTLLQFLPIKNMFTTRRKKNGLLMSLDYSGMELRVFASLAKCKAMIDIHKSGQDFHRMVAALSLRLLSKEDLLQASTTDYSEILGQIDKATRYRFKWTNWTLLYGGNEFTLHSLYDIPLDEAKETIEIYYDIFPEVPEYMDTCVHFAEEHGYIESPFGRREHLPYINDSRNEGNRNSDRRAAVNMPVQSTASDTLLCAMVIADELLEQSAYEAWIVNTVHDSMLLDVPKNEVKPVGRLCKNVMENVVEHSKTFLPELDFSWLLCPLKADIDVGTHYGTMQELEV